MERFKFSVAMSVYNGDNAQFFAESLESVFNQSVQPDEVVLVVDGPVSSQIKSVIETFNQRKNTQVIWLEKNRGAGFAKRISLNACQYNFVAIMDSDDICLNNRFEKQIECFKKDKDLSIVGGTIQEFMYEKHNVIGLRKVPLEHKDILEYLKYRCPFNHMTVMFKKSEVERSGGYLDWHYNEDYYLWIRMYLNKCKFKNLSDILVLARTSHDFYNRRGGMKYFFSESKLQRYMYKNRVINLTLFIRNIFIRFIIQVILPNKLRGFIFKNYFRER